MQLRQFAPEAEKLQELHPVQLQVIHGQHWFKLLVPERFGGLGYTLPEVLLLEEGLAWADGATGWTVTLCAGAGWFIGFLDPAIVPAVFNGQAACLAGSGNASGVAKKKGDHYEITGFWSYATGATLATAFTANCTIEEDGRPLKHPDGSPVIRSFLFLPGEVAIRKNWQTMGMIATGSQAFSVNGLSVPQNRSFHIDQQHAVLPDPIYQFPFLQLAETTLAVNSSGMAHRFIELCEPLVNSRTNTRITTMLEESRMQLEAIRRRFYHLIGVA